jgi:hypothetical protein
VVAAGAVVTRDVLPYEIVAGTPARRVRFRFPPPLVERLLALHWWDYKLTDLEGVPFYDAPAAVEELERRRALGRLQKPTPRRVVLEGGTIRCEDQPLSAKPG